MDIPERVYQRVIHNADRDEATGCLVSRYSVASHGYAQVGWQTEHGVTMTLCHRVVWQYLNGEIPDGYTVDHQCHNRKCVEASHLRLLTNFDNARRTHGKDWPLGQCAKGHPDSELFWHGKGKWRRQRCRVCHLAYNREYNARRKKG